MFVHRKAVARTAVLLAVLLAAATFAPAQEEEETTEKPWTNGTELSWVATSGNSDTSTIGFKNNFDYNWTKAKYELRASFVRAESPQSDPVAVEDPAGGDPFLVYAPLQVTVENYYIRNKYARQISEKFFWNVGADWERNVPAGVKNRYIAYAGVGNLWWTRDDLKFRTDYSLTYTSQEDVIEVPGEDKDFAGARFGWGYLNKWGKVTTYTNDFIVDFNFETSENWRFNMVQGLAVAMSQKLALKVSLEWQYQNDPPIGVANVWDVDPFQNDNAQQTGVAWPYQLKKLDTIFTTSLVINF